MGKDKDKSKHKDKDKRRDKDKDKERRKDKKSELREHRSSHETSEEKRRRHEDRKHREPEDLNGYTNSSNPFGDANLSEKFKWKLKEDKLKYDSGPRKLSAEEERRRNEERLRELEKVKMQRLKREQEKQRWEEEQQKLAREQASTEYDQWERQEAEFHAKQAKIRSEIRLREGRPKPIDILYKNVNMDINYDFKVTEPYKILKGLSLADLQDLRNDITMYREVDSHREFWDCLQVVCDDKIVQSKKGKSDVAALREEAGVHASVLSDIATILRGKTYDQLVELQSQIQRTLESGAAVDVEYWETLLKRLVVFKAKAKLRQIYAQLLRERAEKLEHQKQKGEGAAAGGGRHANISDIPLSPEDDDDDDDDHHKPPSPPPVLANDPARLAAERAKLLEQQAALLQQKTKGPNSIAERLLTEDEMYELEAAKAMEESEEMFSEEVPVRNQTYNWNDKHRPRKPKFFNRVKTGFEWNKYNQTHYDQDNPPPKVVQGYKFNIFYPDLIDKSKTPQYFIEKSDTPGTVLLRFHAGPPYEDIAFKIVDREWEFSRKKGYKCTFERGIVHLWFNFKRYRYRR